MIEDYLLFQCHMSKLVITTSVITDCADKSSTAYQVRGIQDQLCASDASIAGRVYKMSYYLFKVTGHRSGINAF